MTTPVRSPTVHPATIGSRCKRCGNVLGQDVHYVLVRQLGKVGPKQDSLCLECLGLLLLTSGKFVEALAEKLLGALDKSKPPEDISGG